LSIVQVIFVELGGKYTGCTRLSWDLWLESIAIGAFSLIVGVIQKFIPVTEKELPPRMAMVKNAGPNGVIVPKTEIAENMIEPRSEHEPEELFIVKSPKLDHDEESFLESSPLHLTTERRPRGYGRGWEIVRQTRTKIAVVNAFKKNSKIELGQTTGYGRGWEIVKQTRTKIAVVNAFKIKRRS